MTKDDLIRELHQKLGNKRARSRYVTMMRRKLNKLILLIIFSTVHVAAQAQLFGYSSQEECVNKELQKHRTPNEHARDAVIRYCIERFSNNNKTPYRYEKFRNGKDVDLICFENIDKSKLVIQQRNGRVRLPDLGKNALEVIENNRVNTMKFWGEYPAVRAELYVHPYYGYVHLTLFEVKKQLSHLYTYECRET